jgi:sortase A
VRPRRSALFVLLVPLLVLGTGAVWRDGRGGSPDDPAFQRSPITTTSVGRSNDVTKAALTRPVDVPDDPYAPEPLVEIGTMEIPKINLAHRIFHGISLRTIDRGPSHWPGSAMPGEVGNAVFSGHRVTHTKPFRDIDQMAPGDQVFFTVNGVRSTYVMTGSEIVTPQGMHIVEPTATPTATLFACHPPGSAKYRYVVHLALSTGSA